MNGRIGFRKPRTWGGTTGLLYACIVAASAFADTPAEKLPSSTNPQVRAVVDRMGNRIGELETRQAKQDAILDVQAAAIGTVNKAIDKQTEITDKVFKENEGLRGDIKEVKAERDSARKGKWSLAGFCALGFGVLGLVAGYVARGSGARVTVQAPASAPPVQVPTPIPDAGTRRHSAVTTVEASHAKTTSDSNARFRREAAGRKKTSSK